MWSGITPVKSHSGKVRPVDAPRRTLAMHSVDEDRKFAGSHTGPKALCAKPGGSTAEATAPIRNYGGKITSRRNLPYPGRSTSSPPTPAVRAQARHVRAGAARWQQNTKSALTVARGRIFGQIIENHYNNHYSRILRKRGKLKCVIGLRMWRNWQTRRI